MPELSMFITILSGMVISAAVPVITIAVYKFAVAKAATLKHMLTADQYAQFQTDIRMAVSAAEQSGLAKLIANTGEAKKKYALGVLQAIVDARGLNVPVAQIEAEIEDAIHLGLHEATAFDANGDESPQAHIGFDKGETSIDVTGVPVKVSSRSLVSKRYTTGLIPCSPPNEAANGRIR